MLQCRECGKKLNRINWRHLRYSCNGTMTKEKEYVEKYPNEPIVQEELAKKTTISLENFIKKYGEEEGTKRFDHYRKRQADSNSFEYKQKKHGWTKEQYVDFNKSRAVTLDNLIKKHGEIIGLEKWTQYCERQAYTTTLEYFVQEYGDKDGTIKYENFVKSRFQNIGIVSNIEEQMVNDIIVKMGVELDYSCKTFQFSVKNDISRQYFYDIVHGKNVIELYGDYWHMNPQKYQHNQLNETIGKTAQEIWDYDQRKIDTIKKIGYDVKIVWEYDLRKNYDGVIDECVKFLLDQQK